VKRVIGLPGDRLKMVDQDVYINGKKAGRALCSSTIRIRLPVYDVFETTTFRLPATGSLALTRAPEWIAEIRKYVHGDEIVVSPSINTLRWATNRDNSSDSPLLGLR